MLTRPPYVAVDSPPDQTIFMLSGNKEREATGEARTYQHNIFPQGGGTAMQPRELGCSLNKNLVAQPDCWRLRMPTT
jgi:hypothetical protein